MVGPNAINGRQRRFSNRKSHVARNGGKPPTWFRRAEESTKREAENVAQGLQSLSRNLPFVNHVTDLMAGADLMREHPAEGNAHSGG